MKSPASRLRAPSERTQVVETDVLVVGGGVAGCLAVLGAAEAGARVAVCEKGGIIERSGSVAAGVDHFFSILEEGPEWDTPDYLLRHVPRLTDGIADLDSAARLLHGLKPMVHYLEKLGVDFTDPETGRRYYRHRSFGMPGEYTINFDGRDFKHHIGRAARNTGALVLERVMVPEILVEDGQVRGAVAFHIRHGTFYFILARAVVMATGETNRMSRNASGVPFDSWHTPYNTGDGQAMSLRRGARLANMEFFDCTLCPKGYSTQGTNAFVGGGGHLKNRLGERFMFKYHPDGERARRGDLILGIVTEIMAGRGPICCDCTHLPPDEIHRLKETLGVDRPAMPAFFEQKGIDIAKAPFEITVSELSSRHGGTFFRSSGILIDPETRTNVEGLFAAGDCSTMSAGISGAAVMGRVAGEEAARHALASPRPRPLGDKETASIRDSILRPLRRPGGCTFSEFEDEVRAVVTDYVGFYRDEPHMREGLRRLKALRAREAEMTAGDHHGLMRVHEARNIRAVAEAMAASAVERRETRGGGAHIRADYPRQDDAKGLKMIIVELDGEDLRVSSRPTGITPEDIRSTAALGEARAHAHPD
ncbi:MAG: FAD-binding protein [Candidatus Tectomicrobia bacterium]|uniref:FAD-binding protein n=1 Tax=Tectimicrobiota bacterium TaxID=2528274 RepID=A0A932HZI8_UNCTE|nr:FAD-binding protein [Candidatus Tectomicrobia bacterium]